VLVTSPNSLLRAPRAGHGSTPRSPRLKDGSRPYMVGGERRLPEKWIDAGFWWGCHAATTSGSAKMSTRSFIATR